MPANQPHPKIILEITLSIDGFVAGENISGAEPMGKNGIRLHDWIFSGNTAADQKLMQENLNDYGAVLVGGNTYRVAIDTAWEGSSPFTVPAIVVIGREPDKKVDGFEYATNGLEAALMEATKRAETKAIWLMGGAGLAQSCLKAGWVDEMRLHLAPVILGQGLRLFEAGNELTEWKRLSATETPAALHVHYVRR